MVARSDHRGRGPVRPAPTATAVPGNPPYYDPRVTKGGDAYVDIPRCRHRAWPAWRRAFPSATEGFAFPHKSVDMTHVDICKKYCRLEGH